MDYEIPDEPPEDGYKIIGKPYLDHTGVNVRWMDKWGEIHFSNYPAKLWENDQWKNVHDDKVADMYAEHERLQEDSNSEMEMNVQKVERKEYEEHEENLREKVEKKKEAAKKKKELKKGSRSARKHL